MNVGGERIGQVGDELSRIADVVGLVEVGRVPIRVYSAKVSGEPVVEGRDNAIIYNVPPTGFTLGRNGCYGVGDQYEHSIEYFSGDGKSLGQGALIVVRVTEAKEMDAEIAAAREKFGY